MTMSNDDAALHRTRSPRVRTILLIAAALLGATLALWSWMAATGNPATAAETWTAAGAELGTGSPSLQSCQRTDESPAAVHIMEQRGTISLLIGTDSAGSTVHCLAVEVDDGWNSITAHPDVEASDSVPADGALVRDDALLGMDPAPLDDPEKHLQHVFAGEVGSSVTDVVLQTGAGEVEATVSDGWFGAWWPTTDEEELGEPVSALLTLEDGTTRAVTLSAGEDPEA